MKIEIKINGQKIVIDTIKKSKKVKKNDSKGVIEVAGNSDRPAKRSRKATSKAIKAKS
jgi:hypothetical protein